MAGGEARLNAPAPPAQNNLFGFPRRLLLPRFEPCARPLPWAVLLHTVRMTMRRVIPAAETQGRIRAEVDVKNRCDTVESVSKSW